MLTSGPSISTPTGPSTWQRKSATLACGRRGPSSPRIGLACEVEAPCRVSVMHDPIRVRDHGEVRSATVAAAFYGVIPSTPRSRGTVAALASVARDFCVRRETSHTGIRVATRHLDGQFGACGTSSGLSCWAPTSAFNSDPFRGARVQRRPSNRVDSRAGDPCHDCCRSAQGPPDEYVGAASSAHGGSRRYEPTGRWWGIPSPANVFPSRSAARGEASAPGGRNMTDEIDR